MKLAQQIAGRIIYGFFVVSLASTAFAQEPKAEQSQPPKIIRKAGSVLQGSATKRVAPVYPPLAKAARIAGSVVVEVTVDEEGNVISARVISGHPLLKDAAVAAARRWTFSPTTLESVAVKVIGTITFNFHLVDEEEIEAAREKVNANPASAVMHFKLAKLYHDDAQLVLAIEEYNQTLGLDANYVEAYLELGATYAAAGRHEDAIETYKQGLRVQSMPGFAEMLNIALGREYIAVGRNEDALDVFKRAAAINPDSVEGHYNLGITFLKLGDKQSAMAEYEILKDLSEDRGETLRRLIKKDQ